MLFLTNRMNKYIIGVLILVVIFGMYFFARMRDEISSEEKVISIGEKTQKDENIVINNDKKIMQATLNTNKGNITIEFFVDKTPNTVANFIKLAEEGFYDGTKFHRVIKGFMIQGGDPLTRDDSKMNLWGTGDPGYKFADEIGNNNKNDIGTIAMANSGPDTNGSQFFINVASNNFLDGKHTVFGKIVSGMDIVKDIENTPVGQNDRPVDSIVINSITFK